MAGSNHQILAVLYSDVDRVVQAVRSERLWAIEDVILMPQLVRNVFERLSQILRLERKEGQSARKGNAG